MKKETEEARLIREWIAANGAPQKAPRETPVITGVMVRSKTGFASAAFKAGKGLLS